MRRVRFIPFLLLVALVAANNLHAPLMQVVAWSGMLVSYSRDNTLAEAIGMTFDGEHPCPMCKAIEKVQTESTGSASTQGLERTFHRESFGLPVGQPADLLPMTFQIYCAHADLSGPPPLYFPPPSPPPIQA